MAKNSVGQNNQQGTSNSLNFETKSDRKSINQIDFNQNGHDRSVLSTLFNQSSRNSSFQNKIVKLNFHETPNLQESQESIGENSMSVNLDSKAQNSSELTRKLSNN